MKIVFLTTDISQVGGVERVICKLCNYFAEIYKYEIEIISVYKPKNENIYFDLNKYINIKYLNIESNDSSMNLIKRLNNQLKLIHAVGQAVKNEKFDILITTNTMLGVGAALHRKYADGKIIAAEHGDYFYFGKVWRYLRRRLYNKLDKIVVLTQKDKEIYDSFLNNVIVIPNPLPFEIDTKSSLDKKIILTAGRLEDEKGFEYIIDAFVYISKKHPDWKLEIVGEGSRKNFLVEKIKNLGLDESVKISDFTNNMVDKYVNSSIYTLTSKTEAFPLVILEAMECGVPCVSFDLAGPKEIIKDGDDGYITPQYDIEKLVKQINYIIENKDVRVQMGANAKNNIQRYSIKNIAFRWNSLFKEMS